VSSELGQGTSFTIFLPQVADTVLAVSPKLQRANTGTVLSTVLLVEDEDSLREFISGVLTRHGYRVLSASTGTQALEIARNLNGRVHLLLTDVVLPGMNGVSLAKTLSASLSELRVLYMSGYSEFQSYGHGGLPPEDRLLQKPFTVETLLREVSGMLSSAEVEAPC
jgi:DNA-binding response OmpR family regulator